MGALPKHASDKLAKILGMCDSHHDGERAAAAWQAHELVRQHGLTWDEIVNPVRSADHGRHPPSTPSRVPPLPRSGFVPWLNPDIRTTHRL
jgi:hypothetical protein